MANDPAPVTTQSADRAQKKVLVIDDTLTIIEYTRHVLQHYGFTNVVTALNGEDGLEIFYRERPDCVIVDVKMPGLNGYQVVRTIRGDASSADTPLIIVSALQEPDQRLTGMLSGVDEYLPKPYKPQELNEALMRVMKITPEERWKRMSDLADE